MKYCARCGSEYQDSVGHCTDCPNHPALVSAEEMERRGLPLPHDLDQRRFVRAAIAENPLTAEAFVEMMHERNIPVLVRPGRSGVVDELTTGALLPWWEIRVPAEEQARAATLMEQERRLELASQDEAAAAAEAEERESEEPPPPPPALPAH
ncbi:hypothetical protein JGU66_13925 [Myxococcaceae bacterium JPH2]|nr:hypothetical protein [Myxococcaceae bacterium JPH2]